MTEERLSSLEQQVTELRIMNATLAQSVAHLARAVDTLTDTVQTLRDAMNRGRGALWLAMSAAGIAGAGIMAILGRKVGF